MRTPAVGVLIVTVALAVAGASSFGAASGSDKITLCHAAGSGSWNAITVSMSAVSGHNGHSGDIIPAFTTVDNKRNVTHYPGKNLTAEIGGHSGEDVLGNGCATPEPPPAELAHLTVIVKVVNNDGGTKIPSDFTVTVSGGGRSVRFAGQDEPGWRYTGEGGSYRVTQSTDSAYTTSPASCTGTLPAGGEATCVITNDDKPRPQPVQPLPAPWARPPVPPPEPAPFPTRPVRPAPPTPAPLAPAPPFATLATLTVIVKVINDDGGSATLSRFSVLITGVDVLNGTPNFPGSSSGTTRTVTPGAYAVQQSTLAGYATSYSPGCRASVAPGGSAACAIVNDDIAPGPPQPTQPTEPTPPSGPATVTVITVVRNTSGGSRTPQDFIDLIAGTPVVSGSAIFLGQGRSGVTRTVQPGSYGVFQSKRLNYTRTYTGACSGSIRAGQHRTCVVVNRQQRLPSARLYDLTIAKTGERDVELGATTTWRLDVSNLGPMTAPGVAIADRIPAGFRFVAARGAACTARTAVVTCRLGTLRRGDERTLYVTVRAPRTARTAPTTAAVLGTSFETRYRNNVARILVATVAAQPVCPPGTRLYQGACHPIVPGSG